MKFIKVSSIKPVVDYLVETLNRHLAQGERVLWLLSGGSFIPIEVEISKRLSAPTDKLIVGLVDERYGRLGHTDSNAKQLAKHGFKFGIEPVLKDEPISRTIIDFSNFLEHNLKIADFKLGLFGIGPDSHIAGIKPKSPAVDAVGLVSHYDWEDYDRITMTFAALRQLDMAVAYLAGDTKKEAIERLQVTEPKDITPSQILRELKQVIIFNDRISKEVL